MDPIFGNMTVKQSGRLARGAIGMLLVATTNMPLLINYGQYLSNKYFFKCTIIYITTFSAAH
jgi:hypothetical protein